MWPLNVTRGAAAGLQLLFKSWSLSAAAQVKPLVSHLYSSSVAPTQAQGSIEDVASCNVFPVHIKTSWTFSPRNKERLNSPVVWILEAVSQITCCNGHLAKSLQRIITCIFKLVKAAEVKLAKILRRTEINFQMSHCNWFLYHCHKVIRSDA